MKILCGKCGVTCTQYLHYKTIGECPVCKGLLTIADVDDIEVVDMNLLANG